MRKARLFWLAAGLLFITGNPVTAQETIEADTTRSLSVSSESWDDYRIVVRSGRQVAVTFSGVSGVVDFYVFTSSQYSAYSNPLVPRFGYEASGEHLTSYTYTTSRSDLIFVIDNAYVSTTGATPTGPVQYTLTVRYSAFSIAATISQNICFILPALGIVMGVGTGYWYLNAPKPYRAVSKELRTTLR